MSSTQHHDLSAAPFRPSRVLVDFAAAQRTKRQADQVASERAAELAQFRRLGVANSHHRRQPVAQAAAAQVAPAFAFVGGERAFGAADTDRLTNNWTSVNTGINADLERALPTLRARSRDWVVNTDIGRRYMDLVKDNVIGAAAPRLQVRAVLRDGSADLDEVANTAIEQHWATWCNSADITGRLSFAEICRLNVACAARDGEYLTHRIRDRKLPYGYALQVQDVDRIYTGNGSLANSVAGNVVRLGVEINQRGQSQALHLYSQHPGDVGMGMAPSPHTQRVTMDNVFHGYVTERPEQLRGYPWTHAILRRANTLHTYEGYGLEAAKIGAAKMGFYTVDKDMVDGGMSLDDLKDATGQLVQDVEAGMLEALPPGVNFETFNPDYPHQNFDSFVTKFERRVSAGLSVAHHNLSGDMTGVNYSSARIAELAEREHWRGLQRWFIHAFVRPVFEEWLRIALLMGAITLPSGKPLPAERFEKFRSAASFQPRGWRWVDPRNDMQAAEMGLRSNLTSERRIVEEQGEDLDDILLDKQRYRERLAALGLPIPGEAPAMPADPATEPNP